MKTVCYDRLYGHIQAPAFIRCLIESCPGLQRLREVRMANIPFIRFPSFANSSRFEHSIGAMHLALNAAPSLGLSHTESLELALAALYHDVATPAFAHLFESVLSQRFGFDHENKLYDILTGDYDKHYAGPHQQVYFGRRLLLREVCRRVHGQIHPDTFNIAKICSGKGPLGILLNGDIDLDNIDNVYRAASGMGLPTDLSVPLQLAQSFLLRDDKIYARLTAEPLLQDWLGTRSKLYLAILSEAYDFAAQVMLRYALEDILLFENRHNPSLGEDYWRMTDPQLIYTVLLDHNHQRDNVTRATQTTERLLRGDYFQSLGFFWLPEGVVQGDGNPKITSLKHAIITEMQKRDPDFDVAIGLMADKRYRHIRIMYVDGRPVTPPSSRQGIAFLLGLFTPSRISISTCISEVIRCLVHEHLGQEAFKIQSSDNGRYLNIPQTTAFLL